VDLRANPALRSARVLDSTSSTATGTSRAWSREMVGRLNGERINRTVVDYCFAKLIAGWVF
jgi:hypothetical protein